VKNWLKHRSAGILKKMATLILIGIAGLASLVIYDYYVISPWTRDGRVRVQVANVAPQVSGQIVELLVSDNQFVHKGDVLYIIDPFDFQAQYDSARAAVQMKAADLQVKTVQSERRQKLTELATSVEEKQVFAGTAVQADSAFKDAQVKMAVAEINLKRTQVRSPVDGYVTNLLLRIGNYATAGVTNISVVDVGSFWIDGYFEETKMAGICDGDIAEAQLMGYSDPITGRVESMTRGISVPDATPSIQGLPNVDPIYTWVRLAQRVPVRIEITNVPEGVPLVAGMSATVTVRKKEAIPDRSASSRFESVRQALRALVTTETVVSSKCMPPNNGGPGIPASLPTPVAHDAMQASEINPGLTPSMNVAPKMR
jgi:RND family efflux transporter MFP subunit